MKRPVWIVTGVVITHLELLFTLPGAGVMSGASMRNNTFRAVAGPALAGLGVGGRSS